MNEDKNEGLKSLAIVAPLILIPLAALVTALTMGLGGLAVAGIAAAGVLGGAVVSVGVGNTIAKIEKANEKKAIEQNIDKDKNNTKEKSKEKELVKEKTNEIDKEKNMGLKSMMRISLLLRHTARYCQRISLICRVMAVSIPMHPFSRNTGGPRRYNGLLRTARKRPELP